MNRFISSRVSHQVKLETDINCLHHFSIWYRVCLRNELYWRIAFDVFWRVWMFRSFFGTDYSSIFVANIFTTCKLAIITSKDKNFWKTAICQPPSSCPTFWQIRSWSFFLLSWMDNGIIYQSEYFYIFRLSTQTQQVEFGICFSWEE